MRALLILLFSFLIVTAVFAAGSLEDRHIIDWHVHVAGLGYGDSDAFINTEMHENFRFGYFMRWMGVTEKELKNNGDQLVVKRLDEKIRQSRYIDQAVVLALDGVIDQTSGTLDREKTQIYVPNDFIARETAKYPRLLYGASINPLRRDSIERLEQAHRQGAVLIKWIPSIMHFDPSDKNLTSFYQRMAELDMPLLTHTGKEMSFPTARNELADPRRLELPLELGVTVIAAHISTTGKSDGEDNFKRILPMFSEYDNLYTDISSLTQINKLGYLARALQVEGLTERMIYGSDWPLQYFPVVSPWYHLGRIGIINAWQISGIDNPWDRDVVLKKQYGVPEAVFTRKPSPGW
jgi:predicted TIM-barrel fold metal-dependent hydrolase